MEHFVPVRVTRGHRCVNSYVGRVKPLLLLVEEKMEATFGHHMDVWDCGV